MRTALALLGPTASGKSRLAMALAAARPAEIVSLDSAQVYRGMDIGTAKPSAEERRSVPHHLLDVVDPDQTYSTGRWRSEAIRCVTEIHARGKLALIVGGTMLYYRALVGGLDALRDVFLSEGAAHFGSGWVWLVAEGDKLAVRSTHDAACPITEGQTPLLVCDVWEHAYYLDYQNDRAAFLRAWWEKAANWPFAEAQHRAARRGESGWRFPSPVELEVG